MTFSIVAQVGDAFGVAVASKFIAVGSVVPAARLGVGAVATQAFAKVSYKADVLDLLAAGSSRRGRAGHRHRAPTRAAPPGSSASSPPPAR